MEYYTATKNYMTEIFRQMNGTRKSILDEVSSTQKDKHDMRALIKGYYLLSNK